MHWRWGEDDRRHRALTSYDRGDVSVHICQLSPFSTTLLLPRPTPSYLPLLGHLLWHEYHSVQRPLIRLLHVKTASKKVTFFLVNQSVNKEEVGGASSTQIARLESINQLGMLSIHSCPPPSPFPVTQIRISMEVGSNIFGKCN